MTLRLPAKPPAGVGLRAVLLSLARQAKRDVEQVADRPEQRIHSLRTGMKKYRSLLRLANDGIKTRTKEALRERIGILKDGMAGSRDDVVILKTAQRVLGPDAVDRLGLRCPYEESETEAPDAVLLAAGELVLLTETLALEELDAEDLEGRWKRSLRKVRKAMKEVERSGESHAFHLWRKHVKDIWYQSTALGGLRKKIDALRGPAKKLSEVLGSEHDLTIVLTTIENLTAADRDALEKSRERLRTRALTLGVKTTS